MEEIQRKESGGALPRCPRCTCARPSSSSVSDSHSDHRHQRHGHLRPVIFGAMGIESNSQKILMSMLVQVFALISVLVSMRYVDRWGRRPILLTGIAIMTDRRS